MSARIRGANSQMSRIDRRKRLVWMELQRMVYESPLEMRWECFCAEGFC